ncbi:MAG TPA: tryptophan synthase subunit alpha [Candidatus Thermoplasmatota archaeon]|nr:tryptophan synthase subunit alpha [Candidatus Thermoplasmatota archaeon]
MALQAMADARARSTATATSTVLHVYHPLGFPAPGQDETYLGAAIRAGAQVLELGIPFSDPVADGPVLQDASRQALDAGMTPAAAIAAVARLRARHPHVGLVLMAYANSLHSLGWEQAARALGAAGAQGLIVPDMPLREALRVQPVLAASRVPWIPLVSSTVPEATVRAAAALAPPFVYAASLGVTGQAGPGDEAIAALRRIRAVAPGVPVAVGFGVRDGDDVRRLRAAGADGVVVGSALVKRVLDGATPDDYGAVVAGLRRACG